MFVSIIKSNSITLGAQYLIYRSKFANEEDVHLWVQTDTRGRITIKGIERCTSEDEFLFC